MQTGEDCVPLYLFLGVPRAERLKRAGIDTLAQLRATPRAELADIQGFGRGAMTAVDQLLARPPGEAAAEWVDWVRPVAAAPKPLGANECRAIEILREKGWTVEPPDHGDLGA